MPKYKHRPVPKGWRVLKVGEVIPVSGAKVVPYSGNAIFGYEPPGENYFVQRAWLSKVIVRDTLPRAKKTKLFCSIPIGFTRMLKEEQSKILDR
jgi:hypothetical protein